MIHTLRHLHLLQLQPDDSQCSSQGIFLSTSLSVSLSPYARVSRARALKIKHFCFVFFPCFLTTKHSNKMRFAAHSDSDFHKCVKCRIFRRRRRRRKLCSPSGLPLSARVAAVGRAADVAVDVGVDVATSTNCVVNVLCTVMFI